MIKFMFYALLTGLITSLVEEQFGLWAAWVTIFTFPALLVYINHLETRTESKSSYDE